MKHTILFVAANPHDTAKNALDAECAAIEQELSMTPARDAFDFRSKWTVSIDDLMRHLNAHSPTILHFSGHGTGAVSRVHVTSHRDIDSPRSAGIVLQEGERSQYVVGRALAEMIKSASSATRLVVLNACYSAAIGDSLRDDVECVVGIDGAIEDGAARTFAVAFYRALGHRCSVGNGVAQAVATLRAKQQSAHLPVCHTRGGVNADKIFVTMPDHDATAVVRRAGGAEREAPTTSSELVAPSLSSSAAATDCNDLFFAHPSVNTATAGALFDLLQPDIRVFMSGRSLQPSERWELDVRAAQCASRATVLFVSLDSDAAWYLGDEVLTAIAQHRSSPEAHRLVLVMLEPRIELPHSIRSATTIDTIAVGGLDGVAAQLRGRVAELRKQPAPPANALLPLGPGQVSGGRSGRDHHVLYDRLSRLTGSVFDQIVTHARIDRGTLAPRTATLTERALDIAQLAALDPSLSRRVSTELDRRAPWTRR